MKKTFKEIREMFWQSLEGSEYRSHRRSRKKHNDYNATIRSEFSFFVDRMVMEGEITDSQAQRITIK